MKGVAIFATVISLANFGWYAADAQLFASSMINLFGFFGIQMNTAFWTPVLGVLYWLASLTQLRGYMLRDREDLEIV